MARRLNIRQFDAFRALMVAGSTTRAAEALGLSQPSVSRLLSELEGHLGAPLFERRHGRLIPTEEAEWLLQEADEVLSRLDRLDTAVRDIRHLTPGDLTIVASPPLAFALVPACLKRLRASHPNLRATLQVVFRREVRSWVDRQRFDIALVVLPVDYPAEHAETLTHAEAVCLLPAAHPLAGKSAIRAEDLAEEPFVSPLPETLMRFRLDRLFEERGIRRSSRTIETHTTISSCQMVAAGLGVAVADPFTARAFASDGVAVRPFRPALELSYGVLFPLARPRPRLAEAFAAIAREAAGAALDRRRRP
ncbi:LysR substrate-binding domain-containing protein [Afifella pfennigii]|uniref:LysR substrate-binding domain-containing protein n=1 Tax=Afifella pfennigii TaxID=209897 RepID=UPI000479B270|nr:LysR substrate-binding domain-containing protein [Afifella pfennigii]